MPTMRKKARMAEATLQGDRAPAERPQSDDPHAGSPFAAHASTLSRRRFLNTCAGLSLAAPFVNLTQARAETVDGFPLRLLLFYHPNGTVRDRWAESDGSGGFKLGEILEPLSDFRDQITLTSGLDIVRGGHKDQHFASMAATWTGTKVGKESGWAQGPSIDQIIAQRLKPKTPFPTVEAGVLTNTDQRKHHVTTRMCYKAADQPITAIDNPGALFDRLFSRDFSPMPEGSAEAERRVRNRKAVLAHLSRELDSLKGQAGSADKLKFEAHLDGLSAIEKRLDDPDIIASASCSKPQRSGLKNARKGANMPALAKVQIDQVVESLACGLTQIASLQMGTSFSTAIYPSWAGDRGNATHHNYMHGEGDAKGAKNSDRAVIFREWTKQFAYLLERLRSVPEGGGTLLDHTLVVWGTDMATGNHRVGPLPYVWAGGGGKVFPQGRLFEVDGNHRRMLATIAHAMGYRDINQIGGRDTTAISELLL